MPTQRGRGKVVRVRTKRLPDGTLLRVYVYEKRGPRGGKTSAEKVEETSRVRPSKATRVNPERIKAAQQSQKKGK